MIFLDFVLHSRTKPVLHDQWYLKQIGDKYELLWLDTVIESGWESDERIQQNVNDKKLSRNLTRAKQKVFELAYCNEWDWFFTGTLDQMKQDRSNLDSFRKRFAQMIRNLKFRKGIEVDYLIVPELHSDLTNWHCHGLLRGIPDEQLKTSNGNLNWINYENNFGFNMLSVIRSHEAVSKYLTKYITKTLGEERGVTKIGKNTYMHSQGLEMGKVIKKGRIQEVSLSDLGLCPAFENEHCKKYVVTKDTFDNLIRLFV